jgi:hypothetical protein
MDTFFYFYGDAITFALSVCMIAAGGFLVLKLWGWHANR